LTTIPLAVGTIANTISPRPPSLLAGDQRLVQKDWIYLKK
jgi:hypothetical protein